jgi:hypothetical protein
MCSIHPRRLTLSGSFEDQFEKAKSSMVTSANPKSINYHGKNEHRLDFPF